jgi:hypothetical protein
LTPPKYRPRRHLMVTPLVIFTSGRVAVWLPQAQDGHWKRRGPYFLSESGFSGFQDFQDFFRPCGAFLGNDREPEPWPSPRTKWPRPTPLRVPCPLHMYRKGRFSIHVRLVMYSFWPFSIHEALVKGKKSDFLPMRLAMRFSCSITCSPIIICRHFAGEQTSHISQKAIGARGSPLFSESGFTGL